MKREIIFILLLFFGMSFVSSAEVNLVSFNYLDLNGNPQYSEILRFSDVRLKVDAAEDLSCRYDENPGISYDNMEGRFESLIGTSYYKQFFDLFDGNFRVYVKCRNNTLHDEPEELEIVLQINSRVTGQILLSENSPLKEGQIHLDLITSKAVSQAPILTYTVDEGVKYKPIVLTGNGKNWEGDLVLDKSLGEGVLSFKMRAVDLEGYEGNEIVSGVSFPYDTIAPFLITDIKAISDVDEISLEWAGPDDAEYFNIYRSTFPNPTYTDFYDETEDEEFIDDLIDEGKTYYYRITSVDSAGNEASLSREVSGISLEDYEDTSTGLSPLLRGKVESFIVEIESLEESLSEVKSSLNGLSDKEKNLFDRLKMSDKIEKTTRDVSALKTQVENYKNQDLTSEDLDKRIESSRVKLEVYKNEMPSGIKILEEESRLEEITENYLVEALYEIDNFLSEKEITRSLKQTKDFIEEYGVKIESTFYLVEIDNFGGTIDKYYVVKRTLNSKIEKLTDSYYLEIIPEKIVENGKVEVKTLDHDFLSENILVFGADNKEMFYYIQGISEFQDLLEIQSGFVSVFSEEVSNSGLTGFVVFESLEGGASWLIGIVILVLAGTYFIYSRKNKHSDKYLKISSKISEGFNLVKKNKFEESKNLYKEVKDLYKNLEGKEKEKIYLKTKKLYNDILIVELEKGLEELAKTKNKSLLEKLEKSYKVLPKNYKEKISPLFDKLKGEIENEK